MFRTLALRQSFVWRSKCQPTNSLRHSTYPHQPHVDTFFVLPLHQRRLKLILTGTSIPLYANYVTLNVFIHLLTILEESQFLCNVLLISADNSHNCVSMTCKPNMNESSSLAIITKQVESRIHSELMANSARTSSIGGINFVPQQTA